MWRMGRDSNPRYLAVHTLSRRAQSTALAPIRNEPTILVSIHRSCNPFVTPGRFDPRSKRCVDRIGGEPQWKCAAVEFRKGLLRDSLKDLFAAAPVGVATSTILSTQRVETCLHPQGVASIRTPDLPRPLAPRCVGATTRNATPLRSGPANQSLLTSHLRRLRRQPFGDRLQLCLELSLTLVEHIQLQLVTVKLDQSVVYLTSDFGRLGLNFLALAF